METVRLGIVGIGNMGSAHLHCIKNGEVEGMTVEAVCDCDRGRLSHIHEKYPELAVFSDYGEMIEKADINAVLIATPHPMHTDMALMALKADKHILVEKPIDITVSKALALNKEAGKRDRVFGIMFNQRTNTLFAGAREIIKSGGLGEIKRSDFIITNWFRTQSYYNSGSWRATWAGEGGGVLLNQAPHQLDLWQWICGMPKSIIAVCNIAKYHDIEVEDEAIITAEYENGTVGRFITSTGEYPGTNRLEIAGTLGKIVIENGVLKHWKLKEASDKVLSESKESFTSIETEYTEYNSFTESGHMGILQNFTNACLKGEELIAKGTDGINELMISNAAYLSAFNGNKKVPLPFNAEALDGLLNEKIKNSRFKNKEGQKEFGEYNERWRVRW